MAAYIIFIRQSTSDTGELRTYEDLAIPTLDGQPVTPLTVYGALSVLEGPAPEGVVVLQFPSVEEARAWYDSPAYQAAAQHRKAGAVYNVFIAEGGGSV